jgi:hypothetical protein
LECLQAERAAPRDAVEYGGTHSENDTETRRRPTKQTYARVNGCLVGRARADVASSMADRPATHHHSR